MLLANYNIRLIGYPASTITQEAMGMISSEFDGSVEIISPEDFLNFNDDQLKNYTYGAAFTLDKNLRQRVIQKLDSQNLDCLIYIHDSCVCYFDINNENAVRKVVGSGTFISPMSTILLNSAIGSHCIVETYCLLSHYSILGNNVHLHAGTMIAGRSNISHNCEFNFRSSVLPALTVCSDVTLGAASTITKNIDTAGNYVGTPARRVGNTKEKI